MAETLTQPLEDFTGQLKGLLKDPKQLIGFGIPLLLAALSKGKGPKGPTRLYKGERLAPAKSNPLEAPTEGILSGPTEKAVRGATKPYRQEPELYKDIVQELRTNLLEKPALSQSTIGEGGSMRRVTNRLRPEARDIARKLKRPDVPDWLAKAQAKESNIKEDYFKKYGRQPSRAMVAYRMGMSVPEYEKIHQVPASGERTTIRLSSQGEEEFRDNPRDIVTTRAGKSYVPVQEPQQLTIDDKVSFQKALKSLTPTERQILLSIFDEGEGLPHTRLAKQLGVSPATISRMYQGAIKKMQQAVGVTASRGKVKDKPSLRKLEKPAAPEMIEPEGMGPHYDLGLAIKEFLRKAKERTTSAPRQPEPTP
jgi:RNA polymerase sigma factor (sigma-70 family)